MDKQKVLFITPSLCHGGIEQFQISMLQALDKSKYDITLYLYINDVTLMPLVPEHVKVIIGKDTTHYYRRPRAILLNIIKKLHRQYSEKLKDYIHMEKMKYPAKKVFANEQFDIVVANAVGQPTEMALHIAAKKRYVFFHSSLDLHHDLLERLFPQYDGIVAVSAGVKEMLQEAYPAVKDKVLLLENYVDAETILQKAENDDVKLDLDEGVTSICSCGRLSSEKGFDMAVEAASILNEKGYVFKWYFIGDGQERDKVESLIKKYSLEDKICITGYMDNPFSFMKSCDIYVQPSYEESYGRTIKEAMILGRPVVSTATVGGNTLIKNGENGILTEINAKALADGIITLIDNKTLQQKLGTVYSLEQNEIEKQVFKEGLEKILS